MNADKLLRMAEQIAVNVTASRDPDIVAERTADHLRRFWDPRMRAQLMAHVDGAQADVSAAVRLAVERLRQA